jgi:hypothetical protein
MEQRDKREKGMRDEAGLGSQGPERGSPKNLQRGFMKKQ